MEEPVALTQTDELDVVLDQSSHETVLVPVAAATVLLLVVQSAQVEEAAEVVVYCKLDISCIHRRSSKRTVVVQSSHEDEACTAGLAEAATAKAAMITDFILIILVAGLASDCSWNYCRYADAGLEARD